MARKFRISEQPRQIEILHFRMGLGPSRKLFLRLVYANLIEMTPSRKSQWQSACNFKEAPQAPPWARLALSVHLGGDSGTA